MKSSYKPISELVERIDIRNSDGNAAILMGLSIDKCFIRSVANTVGTDLTKYKVIYKNQFAVSLMQVSRDSKIPVACFRECDRAIMSPAYSIFQVVDESVVLHDYLDMWFKRPEFDREAAFIAVGGVRGSMPWEEFARIKVCVPSLERQKEIVDAYKAVNERIHIKQQLNDNLVATVTAIYRRMFIEGGRIYPTAPLKQLCSKIGSGATPKGGKTAYQESGVSLIRSTNVFDYAFSYDDLAHISDEQADQLSNVVVEENDVLFNITGVSVTRCCIVPADVLPARVNQHVMILRPNTAMPMSYYIMTTLCSAENKAKLLGIAQSGSTREAINKQEMESFSIPVPPTKDVQDFEIKARGLYESVIRNTEEIMRLNVMQQLLLSQLSSR
jgi:type I restriction enzyme S subunit